METDKIELVGKIDTFYGDFSGDAIMKIRSTTSRQYHLGTPIEEVLNGLADMLKYDGKVIITFVENKEVVQKARDYFDQL